MASTPAFVPLSYQKPSASETATRARQFFERLDRRRSVRAFSDEEVSENVIKDLVRAASTAPSGAHLQPWTFVAVSDPATKRRIRIAAEAEEEKNYASRMPGEWLRAVEPMGTNKQKPFLDVAPWVIVLFRQDYGLRQTTRGFTTTMLPSPSGLRRVCFSPRFTRRGWWPSPTHPVPCGFFATSSIDLGTKPPRCSSLSAIRRRRDRAKSLSEVVGRSPHHRLGHPVDPRAPGAPHQSVVGWHFDRGRWSSSGFAHDFGGSAEDGGVGLA